MKTSAFWGSRPSSDTSQPVSKEIGSAIKHSRAWGVGWTRPNLQVAFLLETPLRGKSQAKMGQRWPETVNAKVQRTARDPKGPGLRHCGDKRANAGLREARRPRMEELRKRVLGWGVACLDLHFQAGRRQNAEGGSAPDGGGKCSRWGEA